MPWSDELISLLFPRDPKDIKVDAAIALKYDHIPKRLFKYYRCNLHGLANLRNNQVWLTFPANLNDPFDCSLTLSKSTISNEHFRRNLDSLLATIVDKFPISADERKVLENSADITRDLAGILVPKDPSIRPEHRQIVVDALSSAVRNQFDKMPFPVEVAVKRSTLLASFSERCDSILMWSHYADQHKGFCVEYDFTELGPGSITNRMLYPVLYRRDLLDITEYFLPFDRDQRFTNTIGLYAAMVKSSDWAYEQEWRIIIPFGFFEKEMAWQNMPLPRAVYLGSAMQEDGVKNVLGAVAGRNIPIYRAAPSPTTFDLVFQKYPDAVTGNT